MNAPVESLEPLIVLPDDTIRSAMERIDHGRVAIALAVDEDGRLLGTVSDGDLRRAMLGGATLEDPVAPFVSRNPTVVSEDADRAAVLDLMRARRLNQIPTIDSRGRLVGLHVMHEILGAAQKPNSALVLAGGRGTRLGELTTHTPKPMLPVAGRPILERLVLHLVGSGISRIYLSVSYLAEQIQDHFGDGAGFGCEIDYLEEDPHRPLGTGGPLRLLADRHGAPEEPLLIMNGDLVAHFSVSGMLAAHEASEASLTIALSGYSHDVPYGVAHIGDDGRTILRLEEKPRWTALVNAGIYVVEPNLLGTIPSGQHYPITDLANACLDRGQTVTAWSLSGEWHDIGEPRELAEARGEDASSPTALPDVGAQEITVVDLTEEPTSAMGGRAR